MNTERKITHKSIVSLACSVVAACLAASDVHADSTTVFGFQQNNLTTNSAPYGSGAGYTGALDGHILDANTNTALSANPTLTIGNQFQGNQNGRQFTGLFAYDLSELYTYITNNNTISSTAGVSSVSFQLVTTGGNVGGGTGTIRLYETDPFTSTATWNSTNGPSAVNNWTVPFQSGFVTQSNTTFTGGGSSNSVAVGVANPAPNISATTIVAGTTIGWDSSDTFTTAISNALARPDKTLYLAAVRLPFGNVESRVFLNSSRTNTIAQRPLLQITVDVVGTPPAPSGDPTVRKWVGNLDGNWDTTTANWSDTANSVTYADNKAVIFDDTLSTSPLNNYITLSGTFSPSNLVVNNSSYDYQLVGGRLAGTMTLDKQGGNMFSMGMSNSYSGLTTVGGGTLQIDSAYALGSSVTGTVVEANASLAVSNGLVLTDEPLTLNGQGNSGQTGALRTIGTDNSTTVSAPITLGSAARIRPADGGELILNGPITDNGSNYNLTLHAQTAGTVLRVNSANNVAGLVTLFGVTNSAGLITFGVNDVFPTSRLALGGGLFDLNGTDQTFAGLTNGFNPTFGRLTNSSATPSTLTVNYSGSVGSSMTTPIAGNINLVKEGTGSQILGGGTNTVKHTYSGTTTVNAGFLSLSSDLSGVTNDFTVNSGATLRGGAIIGGNVTIKSGGIYYPGSASNNIGTSSMLKDLTFEPGALMIATINPDLAVSNSSVNVSGTLTYGGTLVIYSIGHTNALQAGQTFRIFPPGGVGSFSSTNFNSIETQPGTTVSFNDGLVTVEATAAPTLGIQRLGGDALQIDWTSSFYKLQLQTNALAKGLSTNWVDFTPPMTNLQASVTVTNAPTIPATFFRLAPKP